MSSTGSSKTYTQSRFGQYAQEYVTSEGHAHGPDLDRLLELARPQPDWIVLDVATGGGHTALKFAPHTLRVIGLDLSLNMLQAARQFVAAQGTVPVIFSAGDAENLPFAGNTFDLVTCRIAPHHFTDCFRFVQECARVAKPGGSVLIEDHALPDDARAGRYIDAFERLRDPSHNHAYAPYEWEGMFLDAGLSVTHREILTRTAGKLIDWAKRQGCTPEIIERLQIMLTQAPQVVADWIHPQCAGVPDATFDQRFIIIMGRKETS